MQNNFYSIAFKYIGIYVAYTLLLLPLGYLLKGASTGAMIFIGTLAMAGYIVYGLCLGYGIREMRRANRYQLPTRNVFLFGALMALTPTLLNIVTVFIQSFTNEFAAQRMTPEILAMGIVFQFLLYFVFSLVIISFVGRWLLYQKAGEKGWHSIVPILNVLTLLKIIKKPGSTFFLLLVPLLNIIVYFQLMGDLAHSFRKSGGFAAGLFFLPFIFFPILGCGDAEYRYGDFVPEVEELQLEDHLVQA